MRRLLVAWILLLVALGSASCATTAAISQNDRSFASDDDFRSWFAYYYQNPHPADITAALKYMRGHGYLDESKAETRDMPLIASVFLSRVFAEHPGDLAQWDNSWQKLSQREWYVLLVALYLAEKPEASRLMEANLDKVDQEHQYRLAQMRRQTVAALNPLTAEIVSTRQINLVWAAFSATGDLQYVKKVISAVRFYGDESEPRAEIGEAALMSLATNALQNQLVARACSDENAATADPKTRLLLTAMLSAVAQIADQQDRGDGPEFLEPQRRGGSISH